MLFSPATSFNDHVNAMPREFFLIYNYLREHGVSHKLADQAAREAWANNFNRPERF